MDAPRPSAGRGRAPHANRARRRLTAGVAAASAAVILSGCGLVGVRVSDETGAPLRVGTQPTQGPAPSPTESTEPVPEGLEVAGLTFGSSCPARVSIPLPEEWTGDSSGSSYYGQPRDAGLDSARVSVYCSENFGDAASDAANSARNYQFSDSATQLVVEKTGQAGPGYFWAYQAELGEEEIMHLGEPTTEMGIVAGYPVSGKIYDVRISYTVGTDDAETLELAAASMSHVEIEGSPIAVPVWEVDG